MAAFTTDVEKLVQKFNVTWIDDSFTKLIDSFLEYKFSEATLSHYREALRRQFGHEKYNCGLGSDDTMTRVTLDRLREIAKTHSSNDDRTQSPPLPLELATKDQWLLIPATITVTHLTPQLRPQTSAHLPTRKPLTPPHPRCALSLPGTPSRGSNSSSTMILHLQPIAFVFPHTGICSGTITHRHGLSYYTISLSTIIVLISSFLPLKEKIRFSGRIIHFHTL